MRQPNKPDVLNRCDRGVNYITSPKMKNLPGAAFQCLSDEQHLTTGIHAGQHPVLVQTMTECLGSDVELLPTG